MDGWVNGRTEIDGGVSAMERGKGSTGGNLGEGKHEEKKEGRRTVIKG